jgi:hypothetical protein
MALESIGSEELAQSAAAKQGDVIVVEDLWRTYDMGMEQQVQALRGISMKHQAQRVCGHHGPVRLRQVDAHEPDRLPGHAFQGQVLAQWPVGQRARRRPARPHPQQGNRLRLPDLQPAGPRHLAAQRRAAAHLQRHPGRRALESAKESLTNVGPRVAHEPQAQ